MKIPISIINSAKRVKGLSARNTAIFILCIMILVLSMVIIFSPDNTIASPSIKGVYKIKSNYSGKYLQIENASFDNSAQVKLFSSNGEDIHQMFAIEELGDGYVKIINVNSLKVLDLWGNNDKKNEIVIQYNDKGAYNQQFELQEQDGSFFKIKVRHSGQYLTIKDDNKNEGAVLVQYPFKTSGINNQDWILEEVTPFETLNDYLVFKYEQIGDKDVSRVAKGAKLLGFTEGEKEIEQAYKEIIEDYKPKPEKYYRLKSKYSGLYIELPDNSLKENEHIQQGSINNDNPLGQIFRIIPSGEEGYYTIINAGSNMAFTVEGESLDNNAALIQVGDHDKNHQMFKMEYEKNGVYKIQAKHSGKYITIKSDSKSEGAWIVQWPYKTSSVENQSWILEEVQNPYGSLDDFIERRVLLERMITTSVLLTNARGLGYQVDEQTIESKVNELLNVNVSKIFSDATGFITTFGMLNQPLDKIGFAGAHNAFSNNKDRRSSFAWDTYKTGHSLGTENHNISIKTMLEKGYRVIDLDIGNNGNGNTGCYHRYRLSGYSNLNGNNAILPKIKSFLDENKNEIVIIHLSDVYNGTIDLIKLKNHSLYHKGEENYNRQLNNLFKDMRNTGLLDMTYNFVGSSNTRHDDLLKNIKVPGKDISWPTIKEMLQSGKRVLFLERDEGIAKDIWFKNQDGDPNKTTPENLHISQVVLDEFKTNSSKKFINITCTEDWGASAGDIEAAKINNNGRRIYEIVKKANTALKNDGIDKLVNVLYVDYATGNTKQGGWIAVSPVDAMNRANFDKLGYAWNKNTVGEWYWE